MTVLEIMPRTLPTLKPSNYLLMLTFSYKSEINEINTVVSNEQSLDLIRPKSI